MKVLVVASRMQKSNVLTTYEVAPPVPVVWKGGKSEKRTQSQTMSVELFKRKPTRNKRLNETTENWGKPRKSWDRKIV